MCEIIIRRSVFGGPPTIESIDCLQSQNLFDLKRQSRLNRLTKQQNNITLQMLVMPAREIRTMISDEMFEAVSLVFIATQCF